MDVFLTLFQISFSFFLDALMKIRLPLPLLAALAAAFPAATAAPAGTELGNVMYVGDSITHGVNSASYRWALHKIFTDNGISYQAEGVKTGNYSGGVTAGTSYGGQIFNNEHSSQASARAWEISGRNSGSRFDGSNIYNWLGLSGTKANGNAYSGQTFTGDNTPDTFFMMIGTNDLAVGITPEEVAANVEKLLDRFAEESPWTKIYVQSILPVNGVDTKAKPKNHWKKGAEIIEANKLIEALCEGRKNVLYIDVYSALVDQKGMLDQRYTNDGLHLMGEGYLAWKEVIEKYVK